MELRVFAERILFSDSLEAKLERVRSDFIDPLPGESIRVTEPVRSANLRFAAARTAPAMPHPTTFCNPEKRAIAHHIMANHELQALEVMAWVLLAFPQEPLDFRLGLAKIMEDEQRHTKMHIERAAAMGLKFGSLPVNGYIWKQSMEFRSVLDYLVGLPMTFEGRNLDHTLEFEGYFVAANDLKSAAMMHIIHRDEIRHVAFGLDWMRNLKPDNLSDWEVYVEHLHFPMRPDKSVGDIFHAEPRFSAGMSAEFIEKLRRSKSTKGNRSH